MRRCGLLPVVTLVACATPPQTECSFAATKGLRPFRIERPDASLYGEVIGTGPPLVLVHGGADHRIFHPYFRRLADEFTVVFYDQRGYGATRVDPAAAATTLETDCADLDAIRARFGWDRVDVLAYSHGGPIGISYALHHPEHVGKLILLDTYADNERRIGLAQGPATAVVRDESRARQLVALPATLEEDERALREFMIAPHFFHERPLARDVAEFWLRSGCIDSGDPDRRSPRNRVLTEDLANVAAPTLVLCGEHDRITPLQHSREMAERLPRGRLEILAGCGHLSYADDPVAFERAVREFLRQSATR